MIKIRVAEENDISKIVEIHLERFSSFFLTTLGKGFLKTFYRSFIKSKAILLVLEHEGEVRGFAAGSRSNNGFFKNLVKHNFIEFCLQGIVILFNKPSALVRMFSNASKAEKNNSIFAELLSIATLRNTNGYGRQLLEEFENEVRKTSSVHIPISLTTDVESNDKAVSFYKNCGYEILEEFESYQGRKMYRFIKN